MLCGSTHALIAQTQALLDRIRLTLETSRTRIYHGKRLCRFLLNTYLESSSDGEQRKDGRGETPA
jgi:hypothetical protein